MVLASMEKEKHEDGHMLMIQGQPGDRMYVVESGELEVNISGKFIRKMSRGDICGELALLYGGARTGLVDKSMIFFVIYNYINSKFSHCLCDEILCFMVFEKGCFQNH